MYKREKSKLPRKRSSKMRETAGQWLELPVGLLLLYTLNALADSFPSTATSSWLNSAVKMPQATQSMFYAASFVPYSFKPAYGWLIEVAGASISRPRAAIYATATLGEAGLYVVCGQFVTTPSGAFGAVVLREICAACSEMMLSAALAEYVATRALSASRAQSEATAARWIGTAAAYGISLRMYRCGSSAPPPGRVLACTAVILIPAALVATQVSGALGRRDPKVESPRNSGWPWAVCLFVIQFACAWVALKELLVVHHRVLWRAIFYSLIALCGTFCVAIAACGIHRIHRERADNLFGRRVVFPAALVVALNAAPLASVQVSNLEMYLFFDRKPCYLPYIDLISAVASFTSCALYARLDPQMRWLKSCLTILTVASSVASLAFAPLSRALPMGKPDDVCILSGSLCTGRFAYDAFVRTIDGLFAELALLAQTTLLLRCALSTSETSSPSPVAYGALLALSDAGSSISGWTTAPLVAKAKITYGDFHRLPWLLKVCALAHFLALLPLPLIRLDGKEQPSTSPESHPDHDSSPSDGAFDYLPLRDSSPNSTAQASPMC